MAALHEGCFKKNTRSHCKTPVIKCKINLLFSAKAAALKLLRKKEKHNVIDEITNKILFVSKDTVVRALKYKRCSTYLSRWNSAYASSKAVTKQLRGLFSMNITCTISATLTHVTALLKAIQGHTVPQWETRSLKTNAASAENRYKSKKIVTVIELNYDWF